MLSDGAWLTQKNPNSTWKGWSRPHLRLVWPQIWSSFPCTQGNDKSSFPWEVLINVDCLGVIINNSSFTFTSVLIWTINYMVVQLALQCFSEKKILLSSKRYIYLENLTGNLTTGGQASCSGLVNRLGILVYKWNLGPVRKKKQERNTVSLSLFFQVLPKLISNYLDFLQITVELKDLFCEAYWVIYP